MGTICEISTLDRSAGGAVTAAFDAISRLEGALSLHREQSELSRLNRTAGLSPVKVSESLFASLETALRLAHRTGGAFDPTLRFSGYKNIVLDQKNRTVRFLSPDLTVDLGGIGKGIALDHAARVLMREGVESALINFGGQVYALGAPEGEKAWPVVLGSGETLLLKDASVSTSGNGEQPGHLLSMESGLPVLSEGAVSVAAPSAADADAWSTALFTRNLTLPPSFEGCAIRQGVSAWRTPGCRIYLKK